MSIWRGTQSAIFYYVSCTPLLNARYRKRREKEARRDALSRTEWKTTHPDYPDQVAPNSINPFWAAEIEAGPRIDPGKLKEIKEKRKARFEGREVGDVNVGRGVESRAGTGSSGQNLEDARLGADGSKDGSVAGGARWNHRIYQREDEELWGAQGSSSANLHGILTRPSTAHTNASATPKSYQPDRHPAINDMHPPTTRKISHPEAVAWMFQPLPTAEVMAGNEPPGRSRTNSDLSRSRATSLRKKVSGTPVRVVHLESEETVETVLLTPGSDVGWVPEEEAVEFAFEHTRREVSQRRSLEW
nr:hypothetical protein B0A51_03610 [Rachicladosporium sp. CCFEE 5018]